jgi:hypothetical protein
MPKRSLISFVVSIGLLLAVAATAPAAEAAFGIQSFEAEVLESDGTTFYEQAGGHPALGTTDFTVNTTANVPDGNVRDIRVDVPEGLMSNPEALPRCTTAQIQSAPVSCPPESQLGIEELRLAFQVAPGVFLPAYIKVPLYNMTTDDLPDPPVARFAFNPAQAAPINPALAALHETEIIGGVRWQTDYGLFFTIDDVPTTRPLISSKLTFWGTPADPSHDAERGQFCVGVPGVIPPGGGPPVCVGGGQTSSATPVPFLTNPTVCTGTKLETKLTLTSYAGEVATASSFTPTTSSGGEGAENCAAVPFAGGIDLVPDTFQLDAPTGPLVEMSTPQDGLLDPGAIAPSHVDDVTVTLPPGLTLNPSTANGLQACTDAQLGKGTSNPIACPDASAIGTVTIDTPLLAQPLQGTAYVGQPLAGDQYRLFVTAFGNGVSTRLIGSVRPDPQTGQLTAVFADNPQQPVNSITVDFRDGPLAPLATPADCGAKTTTARYTAYSGAPDATPSSSYESGGPGCQPLGFDPGFAAGPDSTLAGAFSPFRALIERSDRNQFLSGVRVKLPPGLLGMVSRVDQCADAQADAGTCAAGSRIGTASVLAGAGPQPYALSGPVHLTGPYQGAAFGIAVTIRAIAGPYDLGTVIVRQPVFVDPEDARLTVTRAPLPTILEGVPVRLRSIDVDVDRPGFMVNPTSCDRGEVRATLHSTAGTAVDRAVPLQATDCQALPFAPKVRMKLTGKRQTVLGRHPGLITRVTQARGQANLGAAKVTLPLSLALDPQNARRICSYERGLNASCPSRSRIGTVTRAASPALDTPLKGKAFLVQGIRVDPDTGNRIRTLPTILVKLRGQVRLNLRATTDVVSNKLVTTFAALPDAPVSMFRLKLKGGTGGILAATRDVCAGKQIARVRFDGQNGKRVGRRVSMPRPCGS